ncbi:uncharacterized protein LOC116853742 [Odontomachus brunneus]|uniref:uncharacterized protein LOC116853742 n=1 Tax=Odontomachus brunneus TaxID=486640 RepID=UPI0013F2497F|nr:uncharacterized protein LOC116853742 [Odontomachus brunneus]
MTGNIGAPIQLKDLDLRIISIFGGESSVGLSIMEVGLEEQPEDIINPSVLLGLASTNVSKENIIIEEEKETSTSEKSIDKENTISFSLCQDDILLSTFNNKKTYQSHPIFQSSNIDRIPLQSIDEPCSSKQHNVPMSTNMSTQLTIASKESLTSNASSITRCSSKYYIGYISILIISIENLNYT